MRNYKQGHFLELMEDECYLDLIRALQSHESYLKFLERDETMVRFAPFYDLVDGRLCLDL